MVGRILIVLDGAPEPDGPGATTLERARTPALDRLCAEGAAARLCTTPAGLAPGSETGIPTLLGAPPAAPLARGAIEAAAAGVAVPPGMSAWRLDVRDGAGRRAEAAAALAAVAARLPRHRVTALRGHRLLALGTGRPQIEALAGLAVHVWPDGAVPEPKLCGDVVLVCGPGAAAGCGRLLGATVHVPDSATGDVDTDLGAKVAAAGRALAQGRDVVVHVGALDEAAHRGDRDAKRAALERVDAELVAPLTAASRRDGRAIAVTSDHSTSSDTGCHGAEPVPIVVGGPGVGRSGPARLTERAVAAEPILASPWTAAQSRDRRSPSAPSQPEPVA